MHIIIDIYSTVHTKHKTIVSYKLIERRETQDCFHLECPLSDDKNVKVVKERYKNNYIEEM